MELEQNSNISNSNVGNPRFNASVIRMIKDLLKIWWLFLIVAIVAGIAGIYYASKQEITYKSRLTFALDDGDQNGIGSFLNLASQFGINVGSGKDIFAGHNIISICLLYTSDAADD